MKLIIMGLALIAVSPLTAMEDLLKSDPKAVDSAGNSELYRELLKASPDTDIVGGALSAGADPNLLNKEEQAALHIILSNSALQSNGWFVVRVLGYGAKPDEKAIALAQAKGDSKAVELMRSEVDFLAAFKRGDTVNASNVVRRGALNQRTRFENDNTFLHMCLKAGVRFVPVAKELLWQGANPADVNGEGDNALHVLLRNKPSDEIADMVSLLIDWGRFRGGIVDDKAITLALQNKHGELLSSDEKLKRHREAALNQPEKSLFEAIDRCDEDAALFILRSAKNINLDARSQRNETYNYHCKGDTFLHRCAWAGEPCADIIEALLVAGADPQAVNDAGETIVDKAIAHARSLNSIGTRGEKKEFKEPYFVEWLRLRSKYPTQPLRFIVDYDEYNSATGQREQGQMCVTYFSPKRRADSNCQFTKREQKLTCNGKKLLEL